MVDGGFVWNCFVGSPVGRNINKNPFLLHDFFLKSHQKVELLSQNYQVILFWSLFENFPAIIDSVQAEAGSWSGEASANFLEEGGGKERIDYVFSFLLDGFAIYICEKKIWSLSPMKH